MDAKKCQSSAAHSTAGAGEAERARRASGAVAVSVGGFAQRLPDRVDEVVRSLEAFLASADPGARRHAQHLCHRLRGTTGTFGMMDVSQTVARLETLLRQPPDEKSKNSFRHSIRELQAQAQTYAREVPRGEDFSPEPESVPAQADATCKARLLLIDDDEDFLASVTALCQKQLIDVTVASTPQRAMTLCRNQRFDGAVVDIWLDETHNSFDLVNKLRTTPYHADLPVAFVSADEAMVTRLAAAEAGGELFLSKPLAESQIAEAADQLVALRRATRPRLLAVDDDRDYLLGLRDSLGAHDMEVLFEQNAKNILSRLVQLEPEFIVIDLNMGGLDGIDLIRILRTSPRWKDLPIVVLTAVDDVEARVKSYEAGCDDYISKLCSEKEIGIRIQSRIDRSRQQRRSERDSLTGLMLRRPFVIRLMSRISEARRHHRPLSLCLIDLDQFKAINDRYGHLAADKALAAFGRLSLSRLRSEDLRARWGGEEFALAFPATSGCDVHYAVDKLRTEFNQLEFSGDDGERFRVSFSAGVASFPADGATQEELLREADRRLYEAKSKGRNTIVSGCRKATRAHRAQ